MRREQPAGVPHEAVARGNRHGTGEASNPHYAEVSERHGNRGSHNGLSNHKTVNGRWSRAVGHGRDEKIAPLRMPRCTVIAALTGRTVAARRTVIAALTRDDPGLDRGRDAQGGHHGRDARHAGRSPCEVHGPDGGRGQSARNAHRVLSVRYLPQRAWNRDAFWSLDRRCVCWVGATKEPVSFRAWQGETFC